ncbi:MAG: AraC family transcriptional regulator [Sporomusaceae bacterium]|nr:AraC family transcriptional regulator [Sporomusaceae bacterium]
MEAFLCERRTYENKPFTHAHSYSQLIVPIYGSLTVSDGQALEESKQVIFIPSAVVHSFYARASNQFFVFDIPLSYLPEAMGTHAKFYPFNGRWQAIKSLLAAEVGSRPVSNQRLIDLFRYIAGVLREDNLSSSIDYIKKNFHEPLKIQQLADMEHFNQTYYVEWFKKRFGISPIAYIRELRLSKAKELLSHTNYSILQIAQQIGYANQETLTRLFRKETGMTPGAYRQMCRK